MHIVYLILAHKNPGQLRRLVKKLHTKDTSIFIHLDAKTANESDYWEVMKEVEDTFFITHRTDINWGAYSMIQATITSLQEIMDTNLLSCVIRFIRKLLKI